MAKRSPTIKDVALLHQLHKDGQLNLGPEFQRIAVWPQSAKSYLIDTIINDRPIPLIFLQRQTSAQIGRLCYTVIDGQQRLRAIFEFLNDRYPLTHVEKKNAHINKYFSQMPSRIRNRINHYEFIVEELFGYSEADIQDAFTRMNKYVVRASPHELQKSKEAGSFREFVEQIGEREFWEKQRVFGPNANRQERPVAFAEQLAVLLIEGPHHRSDAVDLYYGKYKNEFNCGQELEERLESYLNWILTALPDFSSTRFRKPADLYALIGALDEVSGQGKKLRTISAARAGQSLLEFESKTKLKEPRSDAARYLAAASRQVDNLTPRTTRIAILGSLLRS